VDCTLKSSRSDYNVIIRYQKETLNVTKNFLKSCASHLNLLTKIILVIGILLMAAVGAFAFRMSKGPLDLAFLKPRIEQALNDSAQGYNVSIGSLGLIWPEVTAPLLLDLKNVRIGQDGAAGSSIDNIALGVSVRHLMVGKIMPSIVVIDGPVFQLVQEDGSLNFFWQDSQKTELPTQKVNEGIDDNSIEKIIPQTSKDFKQILGKILYPEGTEFEILSALKRVELKNAIIKGQQTQTDTAQSGNDYLAVIDLELEKNNAGLQGNLNINLPASEGQKSFVKSEIAYRRQEKDITFTAAIQDINPAVFAPYFPDAPLLKGQKLLLDGKIQAAFNDVFKLQFATLDLNMPEGKITVPDVYDEGLDLKNIIFKARFDRLEKTLDISTFKASVGGIPFSLKALAIFDKGHIYAPVTLNIAEMQVSQMANIVPISHRESTAGEWLTAKLKKGRIFDTILTTDFQVTRDPETGAHDAKMTNVKASFNVEDMIIKYSETLMPVKNAVGQGVYENDILTIIGQGGNVKEIKGRNIKLKLTDLSVVGGGMAYLTLDASGPFKTALEYVSAEPISMGDTLGFEIDNVQGHIDYNLNIEFPTIKDLPKEEVTVKIKGKLTDLLIPNIVRGMPLTGGPYDLSFADGAIELKGSGKLAERPITVTWKEYLDTKGHDFKSKITAELIADEGLRKIFDIGLEDYISGPIPVNVIYIDRGVTASVDVTGDLSPATLHLKPFDYTKPASVAGSVSLKAHMRGEILEEVDNLTLKTKDFSFSGGRLIFKTLKDGTTDIARGAIAQVVLGKTKTSVDFEVTPNNTLKIIAKGSVIDISPFIKTDKKSDNWGKPETVSDAQPMIISVETPELITNQKDALSAAKIYLETNKQGDVTRIEMDARVGKGDMYLRFKPEVATGKRTFRLESSDAGATLKAFGLNDKIRGGKLVIYGQPQQGDHKGDLYGKAVIENFRMKHAPALAKLLGAMSQNGVQDLLKNDGIAFTKLESDFEWRFRDAGNLLVMKDGRTSGSSLGLTFEGVINQGTNETDISGTVIPLSGVNKAIGGIPLIGKILTGGKAFLAATYSISGPSNDPKVSINPLSVLAPGFLRTILFEESVEAKVKKVE
jgi:hypothetical protein